MDGRIISYVFVIRQKFCAVFMTDIFVIHTVNWLNAFAIIEIIKKELINKFYSVSKSNLLVPTTAQ